MKLVVFVLCVAAARAASLVGGDECTWGPSYWCSSVATASSCNAFTHCLQTVWQQQMLDVLQTEACISSQQLIEMARRDVSVDGHVQEPLVTSLCNHAPDHVTEEKCQSVLTKFLPEVVKLVESTTEASSVAKLLGLCQEYDNEPAPKTETSQVTSQPTACEDCHTFITGLKRLVNGNEKEERMSDVVVETICSQLGDLEIWCKAVVDTGLPKLLKFLEESDDPDMICGMTTLCESDEDDDKIKMSLWDDVMDQTFSDIEMDTDREIICHDCQKTLSSILNFDKDSSFRSSVRNSIGFLCSQTGLNENQCLTLAEGLSQLPEELMHTLAHDTDIGQVCQTQVGCTGEETQHLQAPSIPLAPTQSSESPYCTGCMQVFSELREVMKITEVLDEARDTVKQSLCARVGSLDTQCIRMVDAFMPLVVEWMTTEDGPQLVCSQLDACPNLNGRKAVDFVKAFGATWDQRYEQLGDSKCDECQTLVEDARAADRNPDVQKGVVDFFNNLCSHLEQEAPQCKALVAEYSTQLFEMIASEMEPTVICEILLHCTKPEEQTTENEEPIPQIQTDKIAIDFIEDESEKENGSGYKSHTTKKEKKAIQKALNLKVGESVECAICQLAMETIDAAIGSNATEQELESLLDGLCDLLPGTVTEPCIQFVSTYTPTVIQLLLQQLDPLLVCNELQVCNDTQTLNKQINDYAEEEKRVEESLADLTKVIEEDVVDEAMKETMKETMKEGAKEEERPQSDVQCQLCELVVGSVDQLIAQNRTQAVIQKALDDVCGVLPEHIQTQCLTFVDEYGVVVVQLLQQELQPQQVCIYLGICQQNSQQQKTVRAPVPTAASVAPTGPLCSLCEIVVNQLDVVLASNKSQAAIESALDKVCSYFPDTISSECENFVTTYGADVINLLVQEIKPDAVCKLLKLCSSAVKVEIPLPDSRGKPSETDIANASQNKKTRQGVSDGEMCIICQSLANYAAEGLNDPATESEIEKLLEDACTVLPKTRVSDCKAMVKQFTPEVLRHLAEKDNPLEVCQSLKVCPPEITETKTSQNNLGEDPCTHGPGFWCASMDNAKQCGMVEECMETYGMKP